LSQTCTVWKRSNSMVDSAKDRDALRHITYTQNIHKQKTVGFARVCVNENMK